MFSVTIPNITPSQNTPVLPTSRAMVTRPSGASCSRRNSAKLSLATMRHLLSGKVRHDVRDEELPGLHVVAGIAMDKQVDASILELADQVDGLGHGADKAARWCTGNQPL